MKTLLSEEGATPLTADERNGLRPTHVSFRHELNELEQSNIIEADHWAFLRKRNVLNEGFLRNLHKRMFGHVWKWAGQYRKSEKNLGVPPWQIEEQIRRALDDARFWIENETFPPDEIAVRLHHRLVFIHPFPNGNGRWSRLLADLLAVALGRPRLTWGRSDLRDETLVRKNYIDALHAADAHDLAPLVSFARS